MTTEVDVESVRSAAEARRWRTVITTEDDINHCRIITVPLLTRFIRERRQKGDDRPLKPVLSWIMDLLLEHGTMLTQFGGIESIRIKESGKKKEKADV